MPIASTTTATANRTRQLYCNCAVPIGTVPCCNCIQCKNHCKCKICPSCLTPYDVSELCKICGQCTDSCCGCIPCNKCQTRFERRVAEREICQSCFTCSRCCVCWTCSHSACKQDYKVLYVNKDDRVKHFHLSCHKCENHCKCGTCLSGTRHSVFIYKMCRNCSACFDHCNCTVCTGCERRIPGTHIHKTIIYDIPNEVPCGLCNRCCRCNALGVDHRKGKFRLINSVFSKGQFKINKLRRHLSCEIEVDKYSKQIRSTLINTVLDRWGDSVVPDGSIPGGFEINMNPTNGDLFLQHVKELSDGLAAIDAGCSIACGCHVHVNVKGTPIIKPNGEPELDPEGKQIFDPRTAYTHYDLRRLIMLYYKIERALFELCSPNRLDAKYSKICGKFYLTKNSGNPKEFRQQTTSKMYNEGAPLPTPSNPTAIRNTQRALRNLDSIGSSVFKQIGAQLVHKKAQKYQPVRYKALNLHSFFMRGTIEFRHKEGTVNYNELVNWALVCGHVVDSASSLSDSQIKALPTDPRNALIRVLPSSLHEYCHNKWNNISNIIRCQQAADELWAAQRLQPGEEL